MNMLTIDSEWTLPSNVQVGDGCFIESASCLRRFRSLRTPGLVLGRGVQVYLWSGFGIEPTGLVEIGDDSIIVGGMFMCHAHITIGRRVIVSYNVTIADSDFHPRDPALRRLDAEALSPAGDPTARARVESMPVVIDDDVIIGIGATVLKGVHVGRRARIGAGAVVTHDVPAGAVVIGNPARRADGGLA